MGDDITQLNNEKSINILDCSSKKEFYLLDEYSDASEFGGLSETSFEQNDDHIRVSAKFIKERMGFKFVSDVMFCGFSN